MIALNTRPLVASLHEQKPDLLAFGRGRASWPTAPCPLLPTWRAAAFDHRRAVAFVPRLDRLTLIYHGLNCGLVSAARERGRRPAAVAEGVGRWSSRARLDPRKGQYTHFSGCRAGPRGGPAPGDPAGLVADYL